MLNIFSCDSILQKSGMYIATTGCCWWSWRFRHRGREPLLHSLSPLLQIPSPPAEELSCRTCTSIFQNLMQYYSNQNSMEIPQKKKKNPKNRSTTWPRNFTSGNLCKENENTNSKTYIHSCDHCSIIYHSQHMEAI